MIDTALNDIAIAMALGEQDARIRQVRDDLGRMSGDHPTGSFDSGGAGYVPEPVADTSRTLGEADVPHQTGNVAMGRVGDHCMTSMPQAEVHRRLVAIGHRHAARAGHAIDTEGKYAHALVPDTSREGIEQNVYDRGDQRLVTEHARAGSGTAVRGFRRGGQ